MTERQALLESIASTIRDYRTTELDEPTAGHVDRWIEQFSGKLQIPMLRELDHVLQQTYFSQSDVKDFFTMAITSEKLAGTDPGKFWKGTNFLRIQQNGESQEELLDVFDKVLQDQCGMSTSECGSKKGPFAYVDDAMFSGNRVGNDLETWIEQDAPDQGVVHVIVMAIHKSGEWLVGNKLKKVIASSGKDIAIKYWRSINIENRKAYRKDAEVLWPAELPDDDRLQAYLALNHKFPFEVRPPGGKLGPFSSEKGRRLLESELTLAGVRILDWCVHPKEVLRPLGFSPFGLGFGATIVTFRNSPNNCPLAFWWGDPASAPDHPFSKWYPLFPRKTYLAGDDLYDFPF